MFSFKKFVFLFVFVIVVFVVYFFNKNAKGTLVVESSSASDVYVNDEFKGTTPYEEVFSVGEYNLLIKPKDSSLKDYNQKITVFSGVKTIVRRRFGEEQSSGEIVYLEKDKPNRSNIIVLTKPEGAKIYINEKYIDVSPVKVFDVSPGQYKIKVRSDMYLEQDLDIVVTKGYTVNVVFDLAYNLAYKKTVAPTLPSFDLSENNSNVISIVDGGDNVEFISVRKNANVNAQEIGKVKVGEEYAYIDLVDGWYQIEIQDENKKEVIGWISKKYTSIQNSNN